MIGTVYYLRNRANGKGYVGQTWMTFDERWSQHCRRDGDMLVQRAIRKHGTENFEREVLVVDCDNQEDLDIWERTFIFTKGTMFPGGYNLRDGGARGRHSDESRRKMSESHRGQIPSNAWKAGHEPWNKGGTASDESKEKMRLAKLGKSRSDAARKAVSEGMKRANLGPSRAGKKRGPYKKGEM